MSELNVQYSKIIHELSKEMLKSSQLSLAQLYLIKGCSLVNKKLIDIALSFGADLLKPNSKGITPLEILRSAERVLKKDKKAK